MEEKRRKTAEILDPSHDCVELTWQQEVGEAVAPAGFVDVVRESRVADGGRRKADDADLGRRLGRLLE